MFPNPQSPVKGPKFRPFLVLGLILGCFGPGLVGQDIEKGKIAYITCMACHGPEGHGNKLLNAPQIAGLPSYYIETQLHNFKHGIRGADPRDTTGLQMRPMSMTLADEQAIKDVAAYVATFTPKVPEDFLEGGDPVKGQVAYTLCLACHGPDAQGVEALKTPSLKYQSDWYMLTSLEKFKKGIRGTNPKDIGGMQMRPMTLTLADEQAMKNVIAYIRSISLQK